MEQWSGDGIVEQWSGGGTVEQWSGGGTVEQWSGGGTVEQWSGGGTVEQWSGGGIMEQWSGGGTVEQWSGGGTVEQCLHERLWAPGCPQKGKLNGSVFDNVSLWNLNPPDFSPKLYKSLGLPQKNQEKRRPPLIMSSSHTFKNITKMTSSILHDTRAKKVPEPFVLRYHPPDSLESKLMFVKFGKYPDLPYRDPRPHDFRQYSDDMPDIVTTTEKDPNNLNFKSQHLSTRRLQSALKIAHFTSVGQTRSLEDTHQHERLQRFDTFLTAEPKWDAELILPKNPWPNKSASYTRHRRRRGLYSAFMDRVEEKLPILWKNC
ncbi:putative uncharacterized protein C7orf78 homolog [Paramormyrops kingsleyae]|uniref:putative uncharacterized protein C7orf78 homolog n=1 Tax=Paramormyrops kingsleyae TaxID=1676925 RepID=UPI003B9769F3